MNNNTTNITNATNTTNVTADDTVEKQDTSSKQSSSKSSSSSSSSSSTANEKAIHSVGEDPASVEPNYHYDGYYSDEPIGPQYPKSQDNVWGY